MHDFIRSIADREVWIKSEAGNRRYVVRQPTVREALLLLSCISDTVRGDADAKRLFFDTLQGWIPFEILALWTSRDYPIARVVAYVFAAVNAGVPDFKKHKERMKELYGKGDDEEEEEEEEEKERTADVLFDELSEVANLPWENYVAEYMSVYGRSLTDTLEEPWNGFLYMSMKVDFARAGTEMSLVNAYTLPWISDERQKKRAMEILTARAGGVLKTSEEKREEALRLQKKRLKQLEKQFGMFQPDKMKE